MKKLTTSKIICSKCKTVKKTQKKQMNKLISVFGSLENVHAKYHCIECRRTYNVRRDGRAKPVVKKRVPKKTWEGGLPEWMKNMSQTKRLGFGPTRSWAKPESVSTKKWTKALNSTIKYGKEKGILIPVKH